MEGKIEIVTPENIQLSFETAGIGSRFLAMLLDSIIQAALIIIALVSVVSAGFTFKKLSENLFSWYTAIIILFLFSVLIGYFIFFETILRGRTPGKAAASLRVIKRNGRPLTFSASVIRNIFRLADMFPAFYAVGIIVIFISKESRRIGDFAAGTVVVKEYKSKIYSIDDISVNESSVKYNPYPLTAEEYHMIKEFLSRTGLSEGKKKKLALHISNKYYNKFNIPMEDRKDGENFLEKLVELNGR